MRERERKGKREKGEGKERESKREQERNIDLRKIGQLLPICTPTWGLNTVPRYVPD